ncbi:hypothetical protein ACS3QZ_03690 [Shimia sp. W99]
MRTAPLTVIAMICATTGHALPPLACEDAAGLSFMTVSGHRLHIRNISGETVSVPLTPGQPHDRFPMVWTTHLNGSPAHLIFDETHCDIPSGRFPLRYYLLTDHPNEPLRFGCCGVAE